jgi:tetratricopeptide (TPR) repeat protein
VKAGKASKTDADKGLAVVLKDPAKATWDMDMKTGIAKRSAPRTSRAEIETCARCHSRRSVLTADYVYGQPLMQTHRPDLLEDPLYFADGQIQDEVYEYGSFLQSKMHAAGVSCSDCHDPHDLKVKGGVDRVCTACHLTEKFETPKHHFHRADSKGASCVACHMPTRNYMVVHARRDHSIRMPRPDLSVALGTPNACNECHRGKSARWAADAALKWWGDKLRQTPDYGEVVHAGRDQLEGGQAAIAAFVSDPARPAIRRGTAASMLDPRVAAARAALEKALADPDPLVRQGALGATQGLDASERLRAVAPLLRDPIRAVRLEAVRALASIPGEGTSASERADFDAGLAEYVASLSVDADRAEAHLQLGALYAMRGDHARAEAEYKTALALTPSIAAGWANLADLYRAQGREDEAQSTLREGLRIAPRDAGLHHALGLALVRRRKTPEAVEEFALAAKLSPGNARYAYVYGVALDSVGQTPRAIDVLTAAHARHTGNPEILEALASFSLKVGKRQSAIDYARKLVAAEPENPSARAMLAELTGTPPPPGKK